MDITRVGDSVPKISYGPDVRASYRVIFTHNSNENLPGVLTGNNSVEKLGFSINEARIANSLFTKTLYDLSHKVKKIEEGTKEKLRIGTSSHIDYEQELACTLKLESSLSIPMLKSLQKNGVEMRKKLSRDTIENFQLVDFLCGDGRKEPGLTFQEGKDDAIPVLWEMMYEDTGQTGFPEWEKFWGFRVPITHWIHMGRPEKIQLQRGLFWATNSHLDLANLEVEKLIEHLQSFALEQPPEGLKDAFCKRIKQYLLAKWNGDLTKVDSWLDTHLTDHWFDCFSQELTDEPAMRKLKMDMWIEQELKHLFMDSGFPFDVIHIACHCHPDPTIEFLSHLDMTIGKEIISLDVSFIGTDLRIKDKWNIHEPGPLVFLNACSTAQPGASLQPPGFPYAWIKYRGAQAVIGTICPVPDYFAFTFAKQFYQTLFDAVKLAAQKATRQKQFELTPNCYIAEALWNTRRHFMDVYNNPLGLAYILYATDGAYVCANQRL